MRTLLFTTGSPFARGVRVFLGEVRWDWITNAGKRSRRPRPRNALPQWRGLADKQVLATI